MFPDRLHLAHGWAVLQFFHPYRFGGCEVARSRGRERRQRRQIVEAWGRDRPGRAWSPVCMQKTPGLNG